MAPTICSSEQKRQVRSGCVKDLRLQTRSIASQHLSAPSSSSILNYVAKGSIHSRTASSLRISSRVDEASFPVQRQVSDDVVSSSTHAHELDESMQCDHVQAVSVEGNMLDNYLPAILASNSNCVDDQMYEPYSDDSMDDTDREVHSISQKACNSGNSNSNSNNSNNNDDVDRRLDNAGQLICCALKTVLNAPNHSDKLQQQQQQQLVHGTCQANRDSQTYTDMCEIKNTEGLLAIAIKTIKLVKRNRMLQQRLAQLQLETSEFIKSVLANPENRHFREKMQQKSPKMEKI